MFKSEVFKLIKKLTVLFLGFLKLLNQNVQEKLLIKILAFNL
jgi:hypothetical protein